LPHSRAWTVIFSFSRSTTNSSQYCVREHAEQLVVHVDPVAQDDDGWVVHRRVQY
jgi:fructose-bisphosphate aldolase class 1